MRTRLNILLACLAFALPLALTAGAQAAPAPSTAVHLSAAQVAQTLFVAGDVGRLSQIPSGTEGVVLEKVLQQLYTDNPMLASSQAVSDIQGLQAVLSSGSQAISPATLTAMAGNERILAILRALGDSNPTGAVSHALAEVTDEALSASSQSAQYLGQSFDAAADSLDTLSFTAFSPAGTLARTWSEAGTNSLFGQARDTLWKQASSESVFDATQSLLAENPALSNSAITSFVAMRNPDGSLDTTVGQLQSLVNGGIQQIADQNCTLVSGASGTTPSDCSAGALHDAQLVAQACPGGPSDTSQACQNARNNAKNDATNELAAISSQQAATTAEATALNDADQQLGLASAAEAEAAVKLADEENAYLAYQNFQQVEKTSFDVAGLAVGLATAVVDPCNAVNALLNVVGDATGFAFNGQSADQAILEGIQSIAQQLSDFEQYTQTAFQAVDIQLSNISSQVSQIAAQITQAQQQLTQLATQISSLQSSVDHLESEVQSLFAQGARNDLGTLVNQYIGYQKANGTPLPQSQFAQAAGALYQDATSTALTQTLLTVPSGFDALSADGLVTGSDPLTLDTNINLFNFFGAGVSDAPPSVGWPGALTTTCPPNANASQDLCLPDPDFWATSARAFSQLLLENPSYVTPTRVTQLRAIQQEGQLIANALEQLSVNNAGSDAGATGNKTLDAAINYFRYWGDAGHPAGSPPSLAQALASEEQRYISLQTVPTSPQLNLAPVNPWRGPEQLPDSSGLQTLTSLHNIPLCAQDAGFYGVSTTAFELPSLPVSVIEGIDPQFQTAARLGLGTISACWLAVAGNRNGNNFDLTTQIQFFYTGQGATNQEIAVANSQLSQVNDCGGGPSGQDPNPFTLDVLSTVTNGWEEGGANNCPDVSTTLSLGNALETSLNSAVLNAVAAELSTLRKNVYNDIISGGAGLTAGDSQATNVQQAALRLDGANELLDGYVSLGLPQALASDDTLLGLISGTNSDTFAPLSGGLGGAAPASNVPAQIINFYKAAINDDTSSILPLQDPAALVANLVEQRASQLAAAINPHIVSTSSRGAVVKGRVRLSSDLVAPQTAGAAFAEENPYIGPTLDRLDETALVLNDVLNGQPTATGTATTPTPPVTPGATGTAAATSAGVKCTLRAVSNKVLLAVRKGKAKKGAPKPGTLSLTVRCSQSGKVKLSGTLIQLIGAKPKHGKQKSKRYRLGPVNATVKAGRALTMTVKLPPAAVTALGKGAKVSATFTLTATNASGSGRATARILMVKGTR